MDGRRVSCPNPGAHQHFLPSQQCWKIDVNFLQGRCLFLPGYRDQDAWVLKLSPPGRTKLRWISATSNSTLLAKILVSVCPRLRRLPGPSPP